MSYPLDNRYPPRQNEIQDENLPQQNPKSTVWRNRSKVSPGDALPDWTSVAKRGLEKQITARGGTSDFEKLQTMAAGVHHLADIRLIFQQFGDEWGKGRVRMDNTSLEGDDPFFILRFLHALSERAPESYPNIVNAKGIFAHLHHTLEAIRSCKNAEELRSVAAHIVGKISKLEVGESLYIPGGWQGIEPSHSGHALMYRVTKEEKGLNFSILNSGAGVEYHQELKEGYRDIAFSWKNVSFEDVGDIFFWESLLSPLVIPIIHSEKKPYFDANSIYAIAHTFLDNPNTHLEEAMETKGRIQRAGTCSRKSADLPFKGTPEYKNYRIEQRILHLNILYYKLTQCPLSEEDRLLGYSMLVKGIKKTWSACAVHSEPEKILNHMATLQELESALEDWISTQKDIKVDNTITATSANIQGELLEKLQQRSTLLDNLSIPHLNFCERAQSLPSLTIKSIPIRTKEELSHAIDYFKEVERAASKMAEGNSAEEGVAFLQESFFSHLPALRVAKEEWSFFAHEPSTKMEELCSVLNKIMEASKKIDQKLGVSLPQQILGTWHLYALATLLMSSHPKCPQISVNWAHFNALYQDPKSGLNILPYRREAEEIFHYFNEYHPSGKRLNGPDLIKGDSPLDIQKVPLFDYSWVELGEEAREHVSECLLENAKMPSFYVSWWKTTSLSAQRMLAAPAVKDLKANISIIDGKILTNLQKDFKGIQSASLAKEAFTWEESGSLAHFVSLFAKKKEVTQGEAVKNAQGGRESLRGKNRYNLEVISGGSEKIYLTLLLSYYEENPALLYNKDHLDYFTLHLLSLKNLKNAVKQEPYFLERLNKFLIKEMRLDTSKPPTERSVERLLRLYFCFKELPGKEQSLQDNIDNMLLESALSSEGISQDKIAMMCLALQRPFLEKEKNLVPLIQLHFKASSFQPVTPFEKAIASEAIKTVLSKQDLILKSLLLQSESVNMLEALLSSEYQHLAKLPVVSEFSLDKIKQTYVTAKQKNERTKEVLSKIKKHETMKERIIEQSRSSRNRDFRASSSETSPYDPLKKEMPYPLKGIESLRSEENKEKNAAQDKSLSESLEMYDRMIEQEKKNLPSDEEKLELYATIAHTLKGLDCRSWHLIPPVLVHVDEEGKVTEIDFSQGMISHNGALLNHPFTLNKMGQDPKWQFFQSILEKPLKALLGHYISTEEGFEKIEFHNNLAHDVYYQSDDGIRYKLLSPQEAAEIELPAILQRQNLSFWVATGEVKPQLLICSHTPSSAPKPFLYADALGFHPLDDFKNTLLKETPEDLFSLFKGLIHNKENAFTWSQEGKIISLEIPLSDRGKNVSFSFKDGKWVWDQNPSFFAAENQSCPELGFQGAHLLIENMKGQRRLLLTSESMISILQKTASSSWNDPSVSSKEFLIQIPMNKKGLRASECLERLILTYRKLAASDFLGAKKLVDEGLFPIGRAFSQEELLLIGRLVGSTSLPVDHSREFAFLQLRILYELNRYHTFRPIPLEKIEELSDLKVKNLLKSLLEDTSELDEEKYRWKRIPRAKIFNEIFTDIFKGSKASIYLNRGVLFSKEEELELLNWWVRQDFLHQTSESMQIQELEKLENITPPKHLLPKQERTIKTPFNWLLSQSPTGSSLMYPTQKKELPESNSFTIWSHAAEEELSSIYRALKGDDKDRKHIEKLLTLRTKIETNYPGLHVQFNDENQRIYRDLLYLLKKTPSKSLPDLPPPGEGRYSSKMRSYNDQIESLFPSINYEKKDQVPPKDPVKKINKKLEEYAKSVIIEGANYYSLDRMVLIPFNLQDTWSKEHAKDKDAFSWLIGIAEGYLANPDTPTKEILQIFSEPSRDKVRAFAEEIKQIKSKADELNVLTKGRKEREKLFKKTSIAGERIVERWKQSPPERSPEKLIPSVKDVFSTLQDLSFIPINALLDEKKFFTQEKIEKTLVPFKPDSLKEPLLSSLMEGLELLKKEENEQFCYNLPSIHWDQLQQVLETEENKLASQLEKLEEEILDRVNRDDLKSVSEQQSGARESLTMEACIGLLLKGNKDLWVSRTGLNDTVLNPLSTLVCSYLVLKTELDHLKNGQKYAKQKNSEKIAEWHSRRRSYELSKELPLHILAFEYASGFRYRLRQKKVTDELLEVGVCHLEMGAGKSSAIGPVTSVAVADGQAISAFCLPDNTYGTGAVNFCEKIFSLFGCKGVELKFSREMCNKKELLQLIFTIEQTRKKGDILIHRPRDLFSLNLMFFERMEQIYQIKKNFLDTLDLWLSTRPQREGEREVIALYILEGVPLKEEGFSENERKEIEAFRMNWLSQQPIITEFEEEQELLKLILNEFGNKLMVLFDEWDTIFDPKNQHCFPVGSPVRASPIVVAQAVRLYFHYLVPYEEALQLFSNKQVLVDDAKWNEIKEKVVKAIKKDYTLYFGEGKELESYLLNNNEELGAVFYQKLLKMENSGLRGEKKAASEIAYLYYALNKGIPMTLKAKGGVGYCQSERDKNLELVIPAEYNGTPKEGTRFRSVYETSLKTVQYYRQFWRREDQTTKLITFLISQVEKEKDPLLEKSIEHLFERKLTSKLLKKPSFIKEATAKLQVALNPESNKFNAALEIIERYLQEKVLREQLKVDSVQINNTPQDLVVISQEARGFSGTRLYADTWPHKIPQRSDPLTDAFTTRALTRPENQKVMLFSSKSKVPKVEEVLKGANLKQTSAFIDASPVFAGESNFIIAKAFLNYFTSPLAKHNGEDKDALLFFMQMGDGTSKLALWKAGDKEPQLLDKSDKKTVKSALAGIPFERVFTYYDHANSIGSDIFQFPGAEAIVSFGSDLTKDKYFQACDRMRGLIKGDHTLRFVVNKAEAEKIAAFQKKDSASLKGIDLLRYSSYVQQEKEKFLNPGGAMEKFSAATRVEMRKELLREKSPKERQFLYEKYRKNLVQTQGESLVQELGVPTFEKESLKVLQEFAAHSLEQSKLLREESQKRASKEIASILVHYENKVPLPEKTSAAGGETQSMFVEVDQSSDVNKDILQDIRLDIESSQKIPAPEKRWPKEFDEPELFTPLVFGTSQKEGFPAVYRLKDALGKMGAFLPDNLCISENLVRTFTTMPNSLLTENQKPIHHLLHIQEGEKETVIAITLEESDFFIEELEERRKQGGEGKKKIRIIEPHGELVKNGEEEPWISPFEGGKGFREVLLAAMLFKGDLQRLREPLYQDALKEWLKVSKCEKEANLFLEETAGLFH